MAAQAAVINKFFFIKVLAFSVEAEEESNHDTVDCTSMLKLKPSIAFLMNRNLLEFQTESEM